MSSPIEENIPSFHIGQLIKRIIKLQDHKAETVADAINVSVQTLYAIYKSEVIDSDKLIKLSVFLQFNFFLAFRDVTSLKDLPDPLLQDLQKEVTDNKRLIATQHQTILEKDKRIHDLEQLNAYQKKEIDAFEKRSSSL